MHIGNISAANFFIFSSKYWSIVKVVTIYENKFEDFWVKKRLKVLLEVDLCGHTAR